MAMEVQISHTIQKGDRWDTVRPGLGHASNKITVSVAESMQKCAATEGRSYQWKISWSLDLFDPERLIPSSDERGSHALNVHTFDVIPPSWYWTSILWFRRVLNKIKWNISQKSVEYASRCKQMIHANCEIFASEQLRRIGWIPFSGSCCWYCDSLSLEVLARRPISRPQVDLGMQHAGGKKMVETDSKHFELKTQICL